jgi:hypothetical protein
MEKENFIIIIIFFFLDNEGFLVEGAALVKGMTWIEICFFFNFFNFLIILIC